MTDERRTKHTLYGLRFDLGYAAEPVADDQLKLSRAGATALVGYEKQIRQWLWITGQLSPHDGDDSEASSSSWW